MITIGKPYVFESGDSAYLKAKITITPDTAMAYVGLQHSFEHVHWRTNDNYPPKEWEMDDSGLWFSVPKEYGQYLCAERGDAFMAALVWYAMVTGSDIKSEAPISSQMYFNMQYLMVPALMKEIKGCKRQIKIISETMSTPVETKHAVGTGMSCGVDSMYTMKLYNTTDVPEEFRLTHLAYFNMGAIFHPDRNSKKNYTLQEFYEATDRMSDEKAENAQQVADLANLPMIYVQSNMDRDYYRGAYGDTAVYRNCSCILALQHLFGKYYCSSAGWPEYFNLRLDQGSEHYESLLINSLSTEGCQFILSDYDSRLEKTIALADDPISQQYLDVCFRFCNCGECTKCYRTLVTLDILGKVDNFAKVFDVDKYKQGRDEAFAWLLCTKDGDAMDDNAVFAKEIYAYIQSKHYTIPQRSYKLYRIWKLKQTFVWRCLGRIKRMILPSK